MPLRTSAGVAILAALLPVLVGCGERGPRILVLAGGTTVTVADVDVVPVRFTLLSLGETVQFVATPLDSLGNVIEDVAVVWASQDVSIATITPEGLAVARSQGQTVITATAGGVEGRAFLAVSLQNTLPGASPGAVSGRR